MENLTILTLNSPDLTDFAAARNQLLKTVKTDWALFLDSDETVSPALSSEIARILNLASSPYNAFSLPRQDTFLGRTLRHGETASVRPVRLVRVGTGRFVRPVHEVWETTKPIGALHNPLLHAPHPTISSFLAKINKYSTLEASYRYGEGRHSSLFHIAVFPFAKFLQNYFLRQGFLDGTPGFIMAVMMGFHSYLTWTKLFLLQQKHPERSRRG